MVVLTQTQRLTPEHLDVMWAVIEKVSGGHVKGVSGLLQHCRLFLIPERYAHCCQSGPSRASAVNQNPGCSSAPQV
jgi:hypothetical protein